MNSVITSILGALLALLTPEVFKKVVDGILDKIENAVAESENTIDDAVVLPLCAKLRALLNVPDNDE